MVRLAEQFTVFQQLSKVFKVGQAGTPQLNKHLASEAGTPQLRAAMHHLENILGQAIMLKKAGTPSVMFGPKMTHLHRSQVTSTEKMKTGRIGRLMYELSQMHIILG